MFVVFVVLFVVFVVFVVLFVVFVVVFVVFVFVFVAIVVAIVAIVGQVVAIVVAIVAIVGLVVAIVVAIVAIVGLVVAMAAAAAAIARFSARLKDGQGLKYEASLCSPADVLHAYVARLVCTALIVFFRTSRISFRIAIFPVICVSKQFYLWQKSACRSHVRREISRKKIEGGGQSESSQPARSPFGGFIGADNLPNYVFKSLFFLVRCRRTDFYTCTTWGVQGN